MDVIKVGDKIKVEYTGRFEDGTIFDSSKQHGEPLQFTVGDGSIIKGIDQAVVGMKIGDEKEVIVPPEAGYGKYNEDFVRDLPRNFFQDGQEVKPGMMFMVSFKDDRKVPIRIIKVADDKVTVDLNSPMTGKTLVFSIKVVGFAG
ncbi:MAG: FKBP-type peptidyl-prolyl cis-trans isomerase [Promethearchaeota archaeon]|jgi:FKBP-type peptidyl-prolyl cis-trans isomerase 2